MAFKKKAAPPKKITKKAPPKPAGKKKGKIPPMAMPGLGGIGGMGGGMAA